MPTAKAPGSQGRFWDKASGSKKSHLPASVKRAPQLTSSSLMLKRLAHNLSWHQPGHTQRLFVGSTAVSKPGRLSAMVEPSQSNISKLLKTD